MRQRRRVSALQQTRDLRRRRLSSRLRRANEVPEEYADQYFSLDEGKWDNFSDFTKYLWGEWKTYQASPDGPEINSPETWAAFVKELRRYHRLADRALSRVEAAIEKQSVLMRDYGF